MKENKSDDKNDANGESITDKASEKVQQTKGFIADYLNERVNKLSTTHKRFSLLMFGFLMGAICLSQVIDSIRSEDNRTSFSIDKITLPKDIHHDQYRKERFEKVLRVKAFLDSLKKSRTGRGVYDSLLIARPGLVDSLNLFIQNYQSDYSH